MGLGDMAPDTGAAGQKQTEQRSRETVVSL